MIKSNITNGQMFLQYEPTYMEKPKVWVKVKSEVFGNHYGENTEEVSLFINNEALAKFGMGSIKSFGIRDKWHITDSYYGKQVRDGKFIPINDLNEVDGICEQAGYPPYEMDVFDF